jgi:RNA polymerase sigma factor (TIGR02999 family)
MSLDVDGAATEGRALPQSAEELLPLVYDQLRTLAAARLAQEQPGQTLSPTALVHEAYLRLAGDGRSEWQDRGHFFAAAAESMRRILVENARKKRRLRHGGGLRRVELSDADHAADAPLIDLIALDEALDKFTQLDPAKAELIKLRYFAGLTAQEAADCLGITRRVADRHWAYARAWLLREIRKGE